MDQIKITIAITVTWICILHLGPAIAEMANRLRLQVLMLPSVLAQPVHQPQEIQAEECLLPQEVMKFRLEERL